MALLFFGGAEKSAERNPFEKNTKERSPQEVRATNGIKHTVPLNEIVDGGVGKDGIPSIDNPQFINSSGADFISDNELVLGINHKGVQRAYPLQILVWHEIVNDNVAGDPILVTYCPLCGTGIAFERKINGTEAKFGVSGKLYNSDLVMYDHLSGTYWSQISGEGIVGELAGSKLRQIPLDTAIWADWKKQHPKTEVLTRDTGFDRPYGHSPYGDYGSSKDIYFPVKNSDSKTGLHPKTIVYGIAVGNDSKAYKEDDIVRFGKIKDAVGGVSVVIEKNGAEVNAHNAETGVQIPLVRGFWFAWYAFHPETTLYEK